MSTVPVEEFAADLRRPFWFQLYVLRDRDLTRRFIERARDCGCDALVLTVDTKAQGPRERDVRNNFTVPPRFGLSNLIDYALHPAWVWGILTHPRVTFANFAGSGTEHHTVMSVVQFIAGQYDLSVNWKDVEWFKSAWGGPLAIKGILTAEDAKLAAAHGADALIVSNHGGRQLDHVPSTIAALPAIVDAVGDKLEVILDGGVRRGSDVVKALALGARACMMGRAWLYGLSAMGRPGVDKALEILRAEIDLTLTLLGRPDVRELDRSAVELVA